MIRALVLTALLLPGLAWGSCETPTSLEALRTALDTAESTRGRANLRAREALEQALACVDAVVPPEDAARVVAVVAPTVGDLPWHAVRLPPTPAGSWWVDGVETTIWSPGTPHVLQERSDAGPVLRSTVVPVGEPPPIEPRLLASSCPMPTRELELLGAVADVRAAFEALDRDGLETASTLLFDVLNCEADLPASRDLGAAYRSLALSQYVLDSRREAAALPWYRAARAADPPGRVDLVPSGHPLHTLFEQATSWAAFTPLAPAANGTRVLVDGQPLVEAPTDRPWLFQVRRDEQVIQVALVGEGEPPPFYLWTPPARGEALDARPARRHPISVPAIVTTGIGLATTAVGASLWGGANASFHAYCPDRKCPGTFYADAIAPQRAVGVALTAAGGAAVATGVTLQLVPRRRASSRTEER